MTEPSTKVRVLVVADDPLARAGLATLLADRPGLTIVGQVSAETDLAVALEVFEPDVVLWDLGWGDPTQAPTPERKPHLERLADVADEGVPIVALLADQAYAADAWITGARGLFLREVTGHRLLAALAAAAQGLVVLDPDLADAVRPSGALTPEPLVEDLTPREAEVLQLLAQGLSNKAIAYRLDISEHTVKFHVNAIMTKLGAQSRTEAAVRATRMGLILL